MNEGGGTSAGTTFVNAGKSVPPVEIRWSPVAPAALDDPNGERPTDNDIQSGRLRRGLGYGVSGIAILSILVGAKSALHALEVFQPTGNVVFESLRFGAHAVLTVSFVYFNYQLLKMAERFCLPHWITRKAEARALLGMTQAESPIDKLAAAAGALGEAAKNLRGLEKK